MQRAKKSLHANMHEHAFIKRMKNALVIFHKCVIFQMIKQCIIEIICPNYSAMCLNDFI